MAESEAPKKPAQRPQAAALITAIASLVSAIGVITVQISGAKSRELEAQREEVEELRREVSRSVQEQERTRAATLWLADWVCEANGGRPHPTLPCYQFTWTMPAAGQPARTTTTPFPLEVRP